MRFICQIALDNKLFPNVVAKMAYFFMTDEGDGEFVDGTYEPDGGENAVILQPGTSKLPTKEVANGPSLYRMTEKAGYDRLQPDSCEFAVNTVEEADIDFIPEEQLRMLPREAAEAARGKLDENKIGGSPVFMQCDELLFGAHSLLLLQLDSCTVPFSINSVMRVWDMPSSTSPAMKQSFCGSADNSIPSTAL